MNITRRGSEHTRDSLAPMQTFRSEHLTCAAADNTAVKIHAVKISGPVTYRWLLMSEQIVKRYVKSYRLLIGFESVSIKRHRSSVNLGNYINVLYFSHTLHCM